MTSFRSILRRGVAYAILLGPGVARSQDATILRVATIPIDAGAEVFYGNDHGFFAKEDPTMHIDLIANGPYEGLSSGHERRANVTLKREHSYL